MQVGGSEGGVQLKMEVEAVKSSDRSRRESLLVVQVPALRRGRRVAKLQDGCFKTDNLDFWLFVSFRLGISFYLFQQSSNCPPHVVVVVVVVNKAYSSR